jgi:hypothetical protein
MRGEGNHPITGVLRSDAKEIAKQNHNERLAIMKLSNIIAALTGIALFSFAGSVQAQYKPTGDDGITASPKQRQFLDEWNRNHRPAATPAEIAKMPCPKCTDKVTTRVDYFARGANKPTVQIVTHQCEGCDTTIKTVGVGKQASNVAVHKCTSCGAETLACCNTAKGDTVATKGMEKKNLKDLNFEVAPVK